MSLNYGIGLDTSQMERDAQRANQIFKNIGDNAQSQAGRIDSSLRNAFAFAGGTAAASAFISQLVNVRGEFQQLEIAFTTMLKSKEKADKLMQDVTQFAATTPFELTQVAAGTKQLLAYGFAADSITDNLSMIGNVAAGVGSQIGDLIYLYGTLKASGRVTQMDINQFAGRGIPIYEALSKVLGTSVENVRSFVTAGKVGFKQVEQAFKDMTSEGGMFNNLMQDQSKSVTGQLSNLGDAVDQMFNKIGQSNQGLMSDVIGVAQDLVANYETVGKVIGGLVATYGAYKAAVMVLTVVQKANTLIQLESALAGRTLTIAQGLQALATKQLTVATARLNMTMLANPYVLAATALVGLVATMWAFRDSSSEAEKVQSSLNDKIENQKSIIDKGTQAIKENIEVIKSETSTQKEKLNALVELQRIYPAMFGNLDIEKIKTLELTDAIKGYKQAREGMFKRSDKEDLNKVNVLLSSANRTDTTTTFKPEDREKAKKILGDKVKWYMGGNDIYELLKVEQKALSTKIDKENKTSNASKFISGISGFSDTQLADEIKKRETLISKIGKSNKVGKLDGLGAYSKDDLNAQLSSLMAEDEKRKAKKYTGGQELDIANKELKTKMAERSKILTSKLTPEDRAKQLKEIDEQIEDVNKRIKLLGGGKDAKKANTEKNKLAQTKSDFELSETNSVKQQGFALRQAEIDKQNALAGAMQEGFEKRKQMLDIEHSQMLLDIDVKTQELIEKQQQQERNEWEKNGGKGVFKAKTNSVEDLNQGNTDLLGAYTQTVNINFKTNKQEFLKDISETYSSFEDERNKINEQFLSDANALTATFSGSELTDKLKVLNEQHQAALQEVNDQEVDHIFKTSDLMIQLFSDASQKSVSELKKIAAEAKTLFDYLSNTKSEDISDAVIGGKKYSKSQLTSMKSNKGFMSDLKNQTEGVADIAENADLAFGGFGKSMKDTFELFKGGEKSIADTKKGVDALSSAFAVVSSFAGQATDMLMAMSTEEGDAASSAAKSIGAVMDVAGATMQGFQQGGYIGAAVAFAMSVTTKIFEAEKAHQEALRQLQEEKKKQQKEYNDLLIEQNELLNTAANIFGVDAYQKAIGYAQQLDQYNEKLYNKSKSTKTASFMGIPMVATEYEGAIAALNNASVKTGSKKTGLFGWGGEKAVYSSLLSTYPELIDSSGKLNKELAQSILNNKSMKDSSKEALKAALDYSEKYDEALQNLSDYMTSVFGSLGGDMMTAITDNLNDSKAALEDFAGSAAGTIEKLMSDIAYSMFFADKFDEMSAEMMKIQKDSSVSPEEKAKKQTELLGNFYSNIGDEVEAANQFLKDSKDAAAAAGFDLWEETREGASKGFSAMTQDQGEELNGRFTAIQGHTYSISESIKVLQINSAQSLKHLAGIEMNTARLEAVENNTLALSKSMDSVKSGIETINLKGVKLQ